MEFFRASVLFLILGITQAVIEPGTLRLADSTGSFNTTSSGSGLLQVFLRDEWGTVCDDSFGEVDAIVACRQMGLPDGYLVSNRTEFGGQIWLDNLGCTGEEQLLIDCPHNGVGVHNCGHSEDVWLVCKTPVDPCSQDLCQHGGECVWLRERAVDAFVCECTPGFFGTHCEHQSDCPGCGAVRLSDATGVNDTTNTRFGLLQVFLDNEWGTVCDDGFGELDAMVACRQMGLPDGYPVRNNTLFRGPIWLENLRCTGEEQLLFNCSHSGFGEHNCGHSEDVFVHCALPVDPCSQELCQHGGECVWLRERAVDAFVCECAPGFFGTHCERQSDCPGCGAVRLSDATGVNDTTSTGDGLLQVFIANQWGSVCDDGFDLLDAAVACRQMGYPEGSFSSGRSRFSGEIWLDNLRCTGEEDILINCTHNGLGQHNCGHSEDIWLTCTGSVDPCSDIVCHHGECIDVACVCEQGWTGEFCDREMDPCMTIDCGDHGDCYNGSCRCFLGWTGEFCAIATDRCWDIVCEHGECIDGICHCHDDWTGDRCEIEPEHTLGVLRLSDASGMDDITHTKQGLLQVQIGLVWGTVCDDAFSSLDAEVACRQMGLSGGYMLKQSTKDFSGFIWLDDVSCTGEEEKLIECHHNGFGNHDCGHAEDVWLNCEAGSDPCADVVCEPVNQCHISYCEEGTCIQSAKPTGTICNNGTCIDGVCIEGTREGSVRLTDRYGRVDTTSTTIGLLQVFHDGRWGSVCDDLFDDVDATVVCRQLGLPGGYETRDSTSDFSGPIWLDDVGCSGNESELVECMHPGFGQHNCGHEEDVWVHCEERDPCSDMVCPHVPFCQLSSCVNGSCVVSSKPSGTVCGGNGTCIDGVCIGGVAEGSVRLADRFGRVDTTNTTIGLLQVFYNGTWGSVCDDLFDDVDATVVCRQLGLPGGYMTANSTSDFSGPIWLDDMSCSGNESSLLECRHPRFGQHNCGHSEDVWVHCAIPVNPCDASPCVNGTCVRRSSSTYECECEPGFSGQHCDDDLCEPNPCRNNGTCLRTRPRQSECECTPTYGGDRCEYQVECELCGTIRLADRSGMNDTTSTAEGLLQVYYGGKWGSVCDDMFDPIDGEVACREFGFEYHSHSSGSSSFSGKTWLDDLQCSGNETRLADCRHPGIGKEDCGHDEDIYLTCNDPTQPCVPSPCPADKSTCVALNSTDYYCECDDGWFGDLCERSACLPNPCRDGGTCVANGTDYVCHCHEGWLGAECQIRPDTLNTTTGTNWAFLIAGSNGWSNYRHQADVYHAYQFLTNHGFDSEHIITMTYDDIAYHSNNPTPGQVINQVGGQDVYAGFRKDYTGNDCTADNLLAILRGDAAAMAGVGSGKVINSTAEDNIFVFYSDHGNRGLIAMPDHTNLYADDLLDTLQAMYNNSQYNSLLFYLESCYSGSMFTDLPEDINVLAVTAASPSESSYACCWDDTVDAYTGDEFSVAWIEDSENHNIYTYTVNEQFEYLVNAVQGSDVHRYGTFRLAFAPVSHYQSHYENDNNTVSELEVVPARRRPTSVPDTRGPDEYEAELDALERAFSHLPETDARKFQVKTDLESHIRMRYAKDEEMKRIVAGVVDQSEITAVMNNHDAQINFPCLKAAQKGIDNVCPFFDNDYALKYVSTLIALCDRGYTAREIIDASKFRAC